MDEIAHYHKIILRPQLYCSEHTYTDSFNGLDINMIYLSYSKCFLHYEQMTSLCLSNQSHKVPTTKRLIT